jgi:argininosuccinate lyase
MTLWDKGYNVDADILAFSAGEEYLLDQRLVPYDCRASIAHATMLASIGALDERERESLVDGLEEIIRLHREGAFTIRPEQEDCHTAIEEWLTARVGDAGKKIHLGRSRNDQVLTAIRLYEKDALTELRGLLDRYRSALQRLSEAHTDVPMPGYTHMRRAMPTTVGTWLSAFAASVDDDRTVLNAVLVLVDRCPLGTGAGYGIPVIPIDRQMTADLLGFSAVLENPIHAHMTRGKCEAAIVSCLSQILLGLNRLATDLLLFSMPEFGFVKLPRELCTGSSIMPQKRNPDVLELVRGHYHVVVAEEFKVKSLVGNLMTGYQRDLGLTKEPVFRALDTTMACLRMMTRVTAGLDIDATACAAAMSDELHATEEAYRLVEDGVPFRDAYRRIGEKYTDQ